MPDDRSSYEFRIVKNPRRNAKQALLPSSEKVVEKNCSGGTFTTNDALSQFRGCTKITGDLIFSGFQPDFTIFKALREITEDFVIENNAVITKISGFENLRIVGGIIYIGSNASLKTVSGFANLRIIRGYFQIISNAALTTISGFANLRILGGNFNINTNGELKTISGFANVLSVAGDFYIDANAKLTTIAGFGNLLSVAGDFRIYTNFTLKTISGFSNLLSVAGEFGIEYNATLTTISGFGNLLSVGHDFYIGTNALLTTISGFANLLSVGKLATEAEIGNFTIEANGGMAKPNKNKVVTTVTGFGKLTPLTGIKGNLTLKGVSDVLLLGIAESIRTNLSGATGGVKDIAFVYPALASQAYTKPASITRRLVPNNLLNTVIYKTVHNTKYIKMNYI